MTETYRKIYRIFQPFVKWLYRIRVNGEENIPEGGAIVAANHTSFSDVLVLSAAMHRQIRYMAKKELFHTPLKPLITLLGAYPVDRGGMDVGSIRKTIALIGEGELIGIFPQGHRNPGVDPRGTVIHPGVGMLAYRTKVPVVPAFLENSRMRTGIFRVNHVTFGKPVTFEELAFTSGGSAEYTNAARIIFDRICTIKYGDHLLEAPDAADPKGERI